MASVGRASGVQERGMVQEKRQELARPHSLPVLLRVIHNSYQKLCVKVIGESDQFIVLRDGRTDQMGKGLAGRWDRRVKLVSDA